MRSEREQLDLFRALPGDLAPGTYRVDLRAEDSDHHLTEFRTVEFELD